MTRTAGLSHVAMSVPQGTLTDEYRTRLLDKLSSQSANGFNIVIIYRD